MGPGRSLVREFKFRSQFEFQFASLDLRVLLSDLCLELNSTRRPQSFSQRPYEPNSWILQIASTTRHYLMFELETELATLQNLQRLIL